MSAFVVSHNHINALVAFAIRQEYGGRPSYYFKGERCFYEPESWIGQVLLDENIRSVNHRYEEQTPPEPYKFYWPVFKAVISPLQAIKACACLDYQSCETPDWQDTRAYAILQDIRERAIRELPGYDEAHWEIE